MTAHLAPCPGCTRHVRVTEAACPFCAASLDASFRSTPRPRRPAAGLGRAAIFAFGVTAAPGLSACGGSSPKPQPPSASQPVRDPAATAQPAAPTEPITAPFDDDDYGSVHAEYGVAPDD